MASGHVNRTQRPNTWLHRPSLRREDFSLPTRSRPHMGPKRTCRGPPAMSALGGLSRHGGFMSSRPPSLRGDTRAVRGFSPESLGAWKFNCLTALTPAPIKLREAVKCAPYGRFYVVRRKSLGSFFPNIGRSCANQGAHQDHNQLIQLNIFLDRLLDASTLPLLPGHPL